MPVGQPLLCKTFSVCPTYYLNKQNWWRCFLACAKSLSGSFIFLISPKPHTVTRETNPIGGKNLPNARPVHVQFHKRFGVWMGTAFSVKWVSSPESPQRDHEITSLQIIRSFDSFSLEINYRSRNQRHQVDPAVTVMLSVMNQNGAHYVCTSIEIWHVLLRSVHK